MSANEPRHLDAEAWIRLRHEKMQEAAGRKDIAPALFSNARNGVRRALAGIGVPNRIPSFTYPNSLTGLPREHMLMELMRLYDSDSPVECLEHAARTRHPVFSHFPITIRFLMPWHLLSTLAQLVPTVMLPDAPENDTPRYYQPSNWGTPMTIEETMSGPRLEPIDPAALNFLLEQSHSHAEATLREAQNHGPHPSMLNLFRHPTQLVQALATTDVLSFLDACQALWATRRPDSTALADDMIRSVSDHFPIVVSDWIHQHPTARPERI